MTSAITQFQSTLPRRERQNQRNQGSGLPDISIHAPAKGATVIVDVMPVASVDFNPRSREGSDHGRRRANRPQTISIHAPAKGATTPRGTARFQPRISIHAPAKGATAYNDDGKPIHAISIHAPAKGATAAAVHITLSATFQSTLPRRERPVKSAQCVSAIAAFQSTLPRRERPTARRAHRPGKSISIHAPAKGATSDV